MSRMTIISNKDNADFDLKRRRSFINNCYKKSVSYHILRIGTKARILIDRIDEMPYKVPALYSLDTEKRLLDEVVNRTTSRCMHLRRSDLKAIEGDWVNVGKDLDGAIRKYQRKHD